MSYQCEGQGDCPGCSDCKRVPPSKPGDLSADALLYLAANERIDKLEADLVRVEQERDELQNEVWKASDALAENFLPPSDRAAWKGAPLWRLVACARVHHDWHHDAADSSYVVRVEQERDSLQRDAKALAEAVRVLMLPPEDRIPGSVNEFRVEVARRILAARGKDTP